MRNPAAAGRVAEIFNLPERESEPEFGEVRGPLMTVGEAAKYLGVSRKVVYSLLESGSLTAVKAKKLVKLVPKGSLDAFLSRGELT
ncbi:MAG: helix-turn-helix domain-containing protein [Deltaproteobacteria bacterium]